MDEAIIGGLDGLGPDSGGWAVDGLELELGGLVAALSASTEDETELDRRVRALIESGRHRITVGVLDADRPFATRRYEN